MNTLKISQGRRAEIEFNAPVFWSGAGMIGCSPDVLLSHELGNLLTLVPGKAIDDPTLVAEILLNPFDQILLGAVRSSGLGMHQVAEVGTVERGREANRIAHPKDFHNVLCDLRGSGRSHGKARDPLEPTSDRTELGVVFTEIVAPVRYTMSLIDHQAGREVSGISRQRGGRRMTQGQSEAWWITERKDK